MWNLYDRMLADENRIKNLAEAANRRLHAAFDNCHPTIWIFIKGLHKVQKGNDLVYASYLRGDEPAVKKSKYERNYQYVQNIVKDHKNRTVIEYLQGIASKI